MQGNAVDDIPGTFPADQPAFFHTEEVSGSLTAAVQDVYKRQALQSCPERLPVS